MEDKGIGRPSTYATIMGKLSDRNREYVRKEKKYLVPNAISFDLIDFLVKYFADIMDIAGVKHFKVLVGSYVRIATNGDKKVVDGVTKYVSAIGNIIDDVWVDAMTMRVEVK
jgi:reverse gyrase